MYRATEDMVKAIVEVDDLEAPSLEPFNRPAAILIKRICEPEYDLDDADDIELLTEVEAWLTAHFYRMRDPTIVTEITGPIHTTYQQKVGLFLQQTTYGQQAMALDVTGALAGYNAETAAGKPIEVGLFWAGQDCDSCPSGECS